MAPEPQCSILPGGGEDVELVVLGGVAVGTEDQRFAVGRELGERGEAAETGDLLEAGAIQIHQVEFEFPAVALVLVGGEEDFFAVGRKGRGETGAAEIGDLLGVAAIAAGHDDFHLHGDRQVGGQQRLVFRDLLGGLRAARAPDEFRAVARVDRAAVITEFPGDLPLVGAVGPHGPEVEVARGERGVDDIAGLPVGGGFGVVALGIGEAFLDLAGVVGEEDVVAFKDPPDIALTEVGRGGTGVARQVRGGVENMAVVREEIAASSAALAGGDEALAGAEDVERTGVSNLIHFRCEADHLPPEGSRRNSQGPERGSYPSWPESVSTATGRGSRHAAVSPDA